MQKVTVNMNYLRNLTPYVQQHFLFLNQTYLYIKKRYWLCL